MRFQDQIGVAEKRFRECSDQRKKRRRHLEKLGEGGDWREVDTPQRVLRRLVSLGHVDEASAAMASIDSEAALDVGRAPTVNVYERIIGENELLGIVFLLKGARVARAVGRIAIRTSPFQLSGFGTGFMVSPRLLMTNNHVLPGAPTARHSTIQFDFFDIAPGTPATPVEFRMRPDLFFETHPHLDFTLVAVADENELGQRVLDRGWIALIAESGKAVVGERVNIIQHPAGNPQQVAVHENQISDVLDDFLHYTTDTDRGSSGSPVLNDQWHVAALHHAGVPKRDDQDRILLLSGDPWDGNDLTRDLIAWEANEGTRISRIVAHLDARLGAAPVAARTLYRQVFVPMEVDFGWPPGRPPGVTGTGTGGVPPVESGPRFEPGGEAIWTIPLQVSVGLGGVSGPVARPDGLVARPEPPGPDDVPRPAPDTTADQTRLRAALARVREHDDEPYYDEDADRETRDEYYPDEAELEELSGPELLQRLHVLVRDTHTTVLSYKKARLDHLYPWIDLREDRRLRSIYSGKGFSPEEVILLDLEVEARREAMLRERLSRESTTDSESLDELLEELEALAPFNCEHVVPQSWFDKAQPMKADLHHLFTCEARCNSFRQNIPYFEFPEDEEAIRDDCGRTEGRSKFEPDAGKGPAARATLYFLLRYPGHIGDENRELQAERLEILLDWHARFPVRDYERHRNATIQAVQGNRNPFIDFPDIAGDVDFAAGFGISE